MRVVKAPFRRRVRLNTVQVLPALVTAGNLVAGLLCIAYLQEAPADLDAASGVLTKAAGLLFLAMFCDAADGRIARLTGAVSPFGAQLDALADVVSFGVAPALLAKAVLDASLPSLPARLLFALAVVYVVGAALRLARHTVEQGRLWSPEEAEGVQVFSGLPSPAAAGVIASLVLVHDVYHFRGLEWLMLMALPLLGLLMISRFSYLHVLNRVLDGHRPMLTVVWLVLLVFFAITFFQQTVALTFFLYALSGPAVALLTWRRHRVRQSRSPASSAQDVS